MSDSSASRFEASINDHEKDGERITERRERGMQKENYRNLVHVYKKDIGKATRVVLFPFRKLQKLFTGSGSFSFNSRSAKFNASSTRDGNSSHNNNNYCCFSFCLSKPQTLDLEFDSAENADDPELYYEHVKDLIEENDFCSRECNTHIVIGD